MLGCGGISTTDWQAELHEVGDLPAGSILLELWAFHRTPTEAVRCWSGDLGWLQVCRGDSDLETKNMYPTPSTVGHVLENPLQEENP